MSHSHPDPHEIANPPRRPARKCGQCAHFEADEDGGHCEASDDRELMFYPWMTYPEVRRHTDARHCPGFVKAAT